eukprot:TRINITY_DN3272_c0_g1_i1.p1 TRINITY_DN3272_c0_g1~~TRINITY_DN3272_c0_g1_i1.p1  ORF type:complete len:227 (-),score=38.46 TRINITY_DN3272_c0_g1_i1:49-729(-)
MKSLGRRQRSETSLYDEDGGNQPKDAGFGAINKKDLNEVKITVPRTFSFMDEEAQADKKLTIRQKWFNNYMQELKSKKESPVKYTFKALEVPEACIKPMFFNVIRGQKERRQLVEKNTINLKKLKVKLLDGVKEKLQRIRKREQEPEKFTFSSRAVPWHVKVPMYKTMIEQEATKKAEMIKNKEKEKRKRAKSAKHRKQVNPSFGRPTLSVQTCLLYTSPSPRDQA